MSESIIKAAFEWWENKRPSNWTIEKHIQNPEINCCGREEVELALAIAEAHKKVLKVDA